MKHTDILLIVVLAILNSFTLLECRGAVGKKQSNSLGSVMYAENPLMYQAGFIAQGSDSVSDVDGNLNIRIKPLETYMLYDESILFCGLPVDMFQGKTEPFLLTYERITHRQVRGVGCHELVAVHSLKTEKVQ